MTKQAKTILGLTSLTLFIGLLFVSIKQKSSLVSCKSKCIVVMSAFFNHTNIYKPNAALLVTDPKEISENESLFLNNKTIDHACGYHYAIRFWASAEKQLESIPFNQECEAFLHYDNSIQSKMKSYIKTLETKPTHYIYNLKIPVAIDPKTVLNLFDTSSLHLFFMEGMSNHYTTLGFSFLQVSPIQNLTDRSKWQGEQDANEKKARNHIKTIVDSINTITPILEQSAISFPMQSFGGGTIEHEATISLKFKNGTNLNKSRKSLRGTMVMLKAKIILNIILFNWCIHRKILKP